MHDAVSRARAQQQQRGVRSQARNADACSFFDLLTGPALLDQVESLLPQHRERRFPLTETLSMFIAQALSADRSCQKAVNNAAIRRVAAGMSASSTHTGAYCRARMRLPTQMVSTLTRYVGAAVSAQAPSSWHWRGRAVRLVDGTALRMPDTPANQSAYPQPRNQQPGLGFPLCRMVGLVCLGSGVLLDAAISSYQGKGSDEQTLLRLILDTLESGELAYYGQFIEPPGAMLGMVTRQTIPSSRMTAKQFVGALTAVSKTSVSPRAAIYTRSGLTSAKVC